MFEEFNKAKGGKADPVFNQFKQFTSGQFYATNSTSKNTLGYGTQSKLSVFF